MEQYKIENLNFKYPLSSKCSLENINLTINHGEFILICGPSGCGKTTLLRQLKTALAPKGQRSGTISFDGENLSEVEPIIQAAKIGLVMQNPDNQIVTDKVWHELAFGLENLGLKKDTIRLRVAETAAYFGLDEWFDSNVTELSGGQKQILNLAAVMAMHPQILILDEPTSQLDPVSADKFLNTVNKINKELGTTIIITEHRLEEVFCMADRVVVMDSGRIVSDASPKEIGRTFSSQTNFVKISAPTAMRIFASTDSDGECPITVRDGRMWLDGKCKTNVIKKQPVLNEEVYAVEIKNVFFRYAKESKDVIKDLSLKIPQNSIFAILGGNGAGKSTLLNIMSGIKSAYSGKVFINSKRIEKYKNTELYSNNIAVLPQNVSALFTRNTVEEDLYEVSNDISRIAKLTHVDGILKSHPFDVSGGEQQRVALAKVLLKNPKIIMLDEPTKGMDSELKIEFADIIKKLQSSGVTVIIISHDIEFCAKYADRCAMLFDGQISAESDIYSFFCDNNFYTTAANRMSRGIINSAVTDLDVIECLKK